MHIGTGHDYRHRFAVAFGKQASLGARVAPIGRVSSRFSPNELRFRDGAVDALPVPPDAAKLIILRQALATPPGPFKLRSCSTWTRAFYVIV